MTTYNLQLGKSGLKVSVPIVNLSTLQPASQVRKLMSRLPHKLGAMSLGSSQWQPYTLDIEKGVEVLKTAWDLGINTVDTANMYSNGESERAIAVFMSKYNIPRHQYIIMTKVPTLVLEPSSPFFSLFIPGIMDTKEHVNQSGLSRSAIFNSVDASLARLATFYVDLLQIHSLCYVFGPQSGCLSA